MAQPLPFHPTVTDGTNICHTSSNPYSDDLTMLEALKIAFPSKKPSKWEQWQERLAKDDIDTVEDLRSLDKDSFNELLTKQSLLIRRVLISMRPKKVETTAFDYKTEKKEEFAIKEEKYFVPETKNHIEEYSLSESKNRIEEHSVSGSKNPIEEDSISESKNPIEEDFISESKNRTEEHSILEQDGSSVADIRKREVLVDLDVSALLEEVKAFGGKFGDVESVHYVPHKGCSIRFKTEDGAKELWLNKKSSTMAMPLDVRSGELLSKMLYFIPDFNEIQQNSSWSSLLSETKDFFTPKGCVYCRKRNFAVVLGFETLEQRDDVISSHSLDMKVSGVRLGQLIAGQPPRSKPRGYRNSSRSDRKNPNIKWKKGDLVYGTISNWVVDRGFGFLAPDDEGPSLFVHQSVVTVDEKSGGFRCLMPGTRVQTIFCFDRKGKPSCSKCSAIGGGPLPSYFSKLEAAQDYEAAMAKRPRPLDFGRPNFPPIDPRFDYHLEDPRFDYRLEEPRCYESRGEEPTRYELRHLPPSERFSEEMFFEPRMFRSRSKERYSSGQDRQEGQLLTGVVKAWLSGKGYGFVVGDDGIGDIFVHASTVYCSKKHNLKYIVPGTRVELTYKPDKNKKHSCSLCTAIGGRHLPSFSTKKDLQAAMDAAEIGLSPAEIYSKFADGPYFDMHEHQRTRRGSFRSRSPLMRSSDFDRMPTIDDYHRIHDKFGRDEYFDDHYRMRDREDRIHNRGDFERMDDFDKPNRRSRKRRKYRD